MNEKKKSHDNVGCDTDNIISRHDFIRTIGEIFKNLNLNAQNWRKSAMINSWQPFLLHDNVHDHVGIFLLDKIEKRRHMIRENV